MNMKFQKSFFCFCFIFIMSVSTSLSATPDESGSIGFDSTITFQLHPSGNFITANNFLISAYGALTLENSTGDELMVVACVDGRPPVPVGIIADADCLDVSFLRDPRTGFSDLEIKIMPVVDLDPQTFSFIFVD